MAQPTTPFARAAALLQAGDLASAERACREGLAADPANPRAAHLMGAILLAAGRAAEALVFLEQAAPRLRRDPAVVESLGLACLMTGRAVEAEAAFRRVIAAAPPAASAVMRLGLALEAQGRLPEAVQALERAATLAPEVPDTHLNLGNALARQNEPAKARAAFERVLARQPGHADARFNLARLAHDAGDAAGAEAAYRELLALHPAYADAWANLGVVLQEGGHTEDATACFRRALELDPRLGAARNNLANALLAAGNAEAAREQYLTTLRAAPGMIEAQEGLAAACLALGRTREAIAQLESVLRAEPDNPRAPDPFARALLEAGRLDEVEAMARRAIAVGPASAGAYATLAELHFVRNALADAVAVLEEGYARTGAAGLLGTLSLQLRRLCAWERWRTVWGQLERELARGSDVGSPFALLSEPTTAQQQLDYARRFAAERYGRVPRLDPAPAAPAAPGRRLRIGYLSSDFHEHATAYLIAEVLEQHDRAHFEVFAYSYGPDDASPMRARLAHACEHFTDIAWDPDDIAARRIRDDGLDLLVDLKGYTLGARTGILARRPAPVQASWLGYPGTMGAPFIDFIIADPFVVPPEHAAHYSERVLRMPHCYQPNDRQRPVDAPRPRGEYGLPDDAVVFCCFNQAYKISPGVYACWMRLLAAVPGSVLWLLEDNTAATTNLRRAALAHDIAAERLVFAPRAPLAAHLARYRAADLALDTFPYGSHTTASDALWAGCPLIALVGETFAARVSGSIVTAAGVPELATQSLAEYETLALKLATDTAARAALRAQLEAARATAPLFDSRGFTRALEQLYGDAVGSR